MNRIPRKLLCLLLAAALCAMLFGCGGETGEQYRLGEAAMDAGRYAEAAGYFGPISDYRSSQKHLGTIYDHAMELYLDGNYREAVEIFSALAPWDIRESEFFAGIAGAMACLEEQDAVGAQALLEVLDPDREESQAVLALIHQRCFEDTLLIRPEYIAKELLGTQPEVTNASTDRYMDILVYAMPSHLTTSVYEQYRQYCSQAFPDSFAQESDSYFTVQIQGETYYICNFHSLYGGLAIKIPRY